MRGQSGMTDHGLVVVFVVLGLGLFATPLFAVSAAGGQVEVVAKPAPDATNSHYVSNRPPLKPSALVKLPIGAIEPDGWIRRQLVLMADGMTGRLQEISEWCDFETSAWTSPDGTGENPWEELPYWLKGYGDLGYVLDDPRIIRDAKKWIEAVIDSKRADGGFGPAENLEKRDFWPHMVMLFALRSYYEYSNDQRVLDLMSDYFKFMASVPNDELYVYPHPYARKWWQWIRAADNLDSIYWLYNQTGESWLLDLARRNHEQTAPWTGEFPNWHGVNICEAFRGPAQFYQQSHDKRHLTATERRYQTVMDKYGQVPGGMFGADENCREGFIGPRQGAETCSIVEFMFSHQTLGKITGDVKWLDRCEEIAVNTFPPALTPDLKALHYITAPNQVQLCQSDYSPMIDNRGTMYAYTPYEKYRCCQHNVSHGWPYYAEHLWMATPDNGLAAVFYAPSNVTAKVGDGAEVTIQQTTQYPFDDVISLKLKAERSASFPLLLRIPGWCDSAEVRINGEKADITVEAGKWLKITRVWTDGDAVELKLPMTIRTRVWEANGNSVSVDRGPLTYSLKIDEKWEAYEKERAWSSFEVFPTSAWNYGLIVDTDQPADSFTVEDHSEPMSDQPFTPDAAPILLKAKGKRIPSWQQEHNGLVGEVPESPVVSEEPTEEITLIPMGCARLRITAFPQVAQP
jgi:hypothetical protein